MGNHRKKTICAHHRAGEAVITVANEGAIVGEWFRNTLALIATIIVVSILCLGRHNANGGIKLKEWGMASIYGDSEGFSANESFVQQPENNEYYT